MRHHDADESHDTADRNRDARHRRNKNDRNTLQPLHVDAAMKCFCFSEHQYIESTRDPQARSHCDCQNGRDDCRLGPGRAAQRSQEPERDVAQLPIVSDKHQKADSGIGNRRDRKPRQQENGDRRAACPTCDAVEDHGCRQRACECGQRQQLVLHEAKAFAQFAVGEHNRGGGGERASAGNADEGWIGEGVSKQSLHDRAGHGEKASNHGSRRNPRNPDRPQHELVSRR